MKIRRITSLSALLSFLALVTTSVILYIVPQGRVAYWADWRLWGLTKTEWGNIHINLGLLFLISIGLHIYYNWKAILSYLKNKAKQIKVFTREFNIALVFLIVFVTGTYIEIAPFKWILEINDSLKNAGAQKYGEPPYGHAELSSLKVFVKKMGFDLSEAMTRLNKADLSVESEKETLQDIATRNHLSPQQVYLAMIPDKEVGQQMKMPQTPPPGTGSRSLADLCQEYSLNIPIVVRGLAEENIKASAEMSLKEIATQNKRSPIDVYDAILKIAERS
ncbi:MAG: DUF4405 domain-containing protein [Desulfobacterales bacterium]|nr:DUF4405 domain-containing protein [Desulfobacterales bacterium]